MAPTSVCAVWPKISIHALREEGDRAMPFFVKTDSLFLSTPSARRATWPILPHGTNCKISIHALREEGDYSVPGLYKL